MSKSRVEAFSDGVIAILITIMVLELKTPAAPSLDALRPVAPTFLIYVLSFIFLGIYWSNHHHLFQAVDRVNGRILWANLHLLFWLSLVPFITGWMGDYSSEAIPTAVYGVVLLLAGGAYLLLTRTIIAAGGPASTLARAVGRDWKSILSTACYAIGIGLSFAAPRLAQLLYFAVAMVWLIPDKRIESMVQNGGRVD